jgi:hypothetical protein
MFTALWALLGCTAARIEGVWMFQLQAADESSCEETVSHNFINASPVGEEAGSPGAIDPWTITESGTISGSLAFGQITWTREGEALLVMGGLAWPGTGDGDSWVFEWEGLETDSYSESHSQGYNYTRTLQESSITAVSLTFGERDLASGSLTEASSSLTAWSENDTWNDGRVGVGGGQIPAGDYLVVTDPLTGAESAASNASLNQDCNNEPCSLSLSTICDSTRSLEAARTGYGDEDAYDLLEGYGQSEGVQ